MTSTVTQQSQRDDRRDVDDLKKDSTGQDASIVVVCKRA